MSFKNSFKKQKLNWFIHNSKTVLHLSRSESNYKRVAYWRRVIAIGCEVYLLIRLTTYWKGISDFEITRHVGALKVWLSWVN